jgi:hypothetical protein
MIRVVAFVPLLMLLGCADQSRGTALSECRQKYFLESPVAQGQAMPDCMKVKAFETVPGCSPEVDEHEWDWQVRTFAFDNPKCYRPLGSATWIATILSPM